MQGTKVGFKEIGRAGRLCSSRYVSKFGENRYKIVRGIGNHFFEIFLEVGSFQITGGEIFLLFSSSFFFRCSRFFSRLSLFISTTIGDLTSLCKLTDQPSCTTISFFNVFSRSFDYILANIFRVLTFIFYFFL